MKIKTGIEGGKQGDHDWNLADGNDVRITKKYIKFPEPFFRETPHLMISLVKFHTFDDDPDKREINNRLEVTYDGLDKNGFNLVFQTWSNSKVREAEVRWLAIEKTKDE